MRWGFREILEMRAADIIMPDFQKRGRLLDASTIAAIAHKYYVPALHSSAIRDRRTLILGSANSLLLWPAELNPLFGRMRRDRVAGGELG
jgi:hypothetical protein